MLCHVVSRHVVLHDGDMCRCIAYPCAVAHDVSSVDGGAGDAFLSPGPVWWLHAEAGSQGADRVHRMSYRGFGYLCSHHLITYRIWHTPCHYSMYVCSVMCNCKSVVCTCMQVFHRHAFRENEGEAERERERDAEMLRH